MENLVMEPANRSLDPIPPRERREELGRATGAHPFRGARGFVEVVEETEREHDVERAREIEVEEVAFDELDRLVCVEAITRERQHARREVDADICRRPRVDNRLRDASRSAPDVEDIGSTLLRHDRDREFPPALRSTP